MSKRTARIALTAPPPPRRAGARPPRRPPRAPPPRPGAGRQEAAPARERLRVVLEEVHDRARARGRAVALGERAVGRRRHEQRHALARPDGAERGAGPPRLAPA